MMAPCGRRRGRGNGCDLTRCLVKEHDRWMILANSIRIFAREGNQRGIVSKLEPHVTLPFPRPVEWPRLFELLHLVLTQRPRIIEWLQSPVFVRAPKDYFAGWVRHRMMKTQACKEPCQHHRSALLDQEDWVGQPRGV